MKLKISPLDTLGARNTRAAVNISVHTERVLDNNGPALVRECYEAFSATITRLTKEWILLGLTDESDRREFKLRRDSWVVWFRVLHDCIGDIDAGRPLNPVHALTAIAWLEAELFGFGETLRETRRSAES